MSPALCYGKDTTSFLFVFFSFHCPTLAASTRSVLLSPMFRSAPARAGYCDCAQSHWLVQASTQWKGKHVAAHSPLEVASSRDLWTVSNHSLCELASLSRPSHVHHMGSCTTIVCCPGKLQRRFNCPLLPSTSFHSGVACQRNWVNYLLLGRPRLQELLFHSFSEDLLHGFYNEQSVPLLALSTVP